MSTCLELSFVGIFFFLVGSINTRWVVKGDYQDVQEDVMIGECLGMMVWRIGSARESQLYEELLIFSRRTNVVLS